MGVPSCRSLIFRTTSNETFHAFLYAPPLNGLSRGLRRLLASLLE